MGLNSSTAPPVLRQRFISGSSEQSNTVADTAYVSRALDQQRPKHTSTGALSAYCDLICVTPKSAYKLPDPL